MKLLYVGGFASAQKGAVGTHTLGILRAFQQSGVELHAIFLEDQVPEGFDGPATIIPACRRPGLHKKLIDRFRIARAAARMAGGFDYLYERYDPFISPLIGRGDLILEYNDDFIDQIKFATASGHFGRFGALVRGSRLYTSLFKSIERYCFRRARLVVCVTQRLCETVSRREPESRTFCMLNGSDASYDPALDPGRRDDVLRLGHIGTVTYWDGLKELFHGLAEFRAANPGKRAEVLIVGFGDLKPELISLAERLALDDVVEFRPSVGYREALACLHEVDVVPLLKTISSYDLSPIKFYEALCAGRLVLCSDIRHINEVDPEPGIVVGFPLNVGEISQAIASLHARLPEIRAGFEARSRSAREAHSWKNRVSSLIEALASERGSPAFESKTEA